MEQHGPDQALVLEHGMSPDGSECKDHNPKDKPTPREFVSCIDVREPKDQGGDEDRAGSANQRIKWIQEDGAKPELFHDGVCQYKEQQPGDIFDDQLQEF